MDVTPLPAENGKVKSEGNVRAGHRLRGKDENGDPRPALTTFLTDLT